MNVVASVNAPMHQQESEAQKFDATVRKILSVSHKELQKREKTWKMKRAKKKLAK